MLLIALCLASALSVHDGNPAAPLVLTDETHELEVSSALQVITGADPAMTLDQARVSEQFKPVEGHPSFGFEGGTFWLRFTVRNQRTTTEPWLLMLDNALVESIQLFVLLPDGTVQRHAGGLRHVHEADVRHRQPVFRLDLPRSVDVAIYVRAETQWNANFPMRFLSDARLRATDAWVMVFFGIFFGMALIMVLYNLFIGIALRESNSLWYALWVGTMAPTLPIDHGMLNVMFPELVPWTSQLIATHFTVGIGLTVQLGRTFLRTRELTPRVDRFLRFALWLCPINLFTSYVAFDKSLIISMVLMIPVPWTLVGVSVYLWVKGNRSASYFAVAQLAFMFAANLSTMAGSGLVPAIFSYGVVAGAALQMVLFSFGLADRTNRLNREKLAVQQKALETQTHMAESFARFVPREFLHHLKLDNIVDVKLGDQVQLEMTVLFTDIRSFTDRSERMTPRETFEFINGYMREIGPVIRRHHGFIDKYIGDAIMALFPTSPEDALRCAVDILVELRSVNAKLAARGVDPIRMGIGMHTGTLMLGVVGEEKRLEGTVISDAVNLASRVEGLSKYYGASVVATENSLRGSVHPPASRPLGRVRVKGKQHPVLLFEVYAGDDDDVRTGKDATRELFEQALEHHFAGRFTEAAAGFQQVLQRNPADGAAQFYAKRCEHHAKHGAPEGWQGVESFESK
ncbi:MAG: 7TM diverse intracellular signaling domain-containing protein [Myxococcota bacterium]